MDPGYSNHEDGMDGGGGTSRLGNGLERCSVGTKHRGSFVYELNNNTTATNTNDQNQSKAGHFCLYSDPRNRKSLWPRGILKSKVLRGLVGVIILVYMVCFNALVSTRIGDKPKWGPEPREPEPREPEPTLDSTRIGDPNPRNGTVMWHCHMGFADPNPGGAGIMKQMRTFLGAYIVAVEKNAYLIKGNLSYEYTDNTAAGCNAPMEAMVDIDAMPGLRHMLVEEPIGEHIQAPCEPCWKSEFKWTPERTSTYKNARRAFKASKRLRTLVPQSLCPVDSCVCLHSRLEKDFVDFLRREAGTENGLAMAITRHAKTVGFGNSTILYVAGKQSDKYHSIPTFANVTSKPDYPSLRPFEKAIVDLQICQNALFHIGTSRSIFDEWISEERLLNHRTQSWDYFGNNGLRHKPFPNRKAHLGELSQD